MKIEETTNEGLRRAYRVTITAKDIDAADFSMDNLEDLETGGADASEETRRQTDAFGDYLTDTCGNPMDDIEMPEIPETTARRLIEVVHMVRALDLKKPPSIAESIDWARARRGPRPSRCATRAARLSFGMRAWRNW